MLENFKARKALQEHRKKSGHIPDSEEEKEQEKNLRKMVKCTEDECNFETSRPDYLLRHQRLVHGLHRKDFKAVNNTLQMEINGLALNVEKHSQVFQKFKCILFNVKKLNVSFAIKLSL